MNSRLKRFRRQNHEAELDITAFMNLMIVLVPVLLLSMVFSRITAIDITLPELSNSVSDEEDNQHLELLISNEGMVINYPRGTPLKRLPRTAAGDQDYALLSLTLQEIKRQLREKELDSASITLMPEPVVDYQTIVRVMDTVRSFKAVVAGDVVDAALFPEIAFADAPGVER